MNQERYCSVCIRQCEKGNSFCHRRDNTGYLKETDRINAIQIDYLFDKPILHYNGNIKVLSIGSWGCNFRCLGCQNTELSWTETGENLAHRTMSAGDIIEMAVKNDCQGICYTYNEPAILLEAVENIACRAKDSGLVNVFVTNCTLTEKSTKRISRCIDAVAADIKSLRDDFYYEYCGARGIPDVTAKILKCIRTFHDAGNHVEIRTNIITGANDQTGNFHSVASWIRSNLGAATPWHITRFFPAHKLSHLPKTSMEILLEAQKAGFEEGLNFVHIHPDKGCDCAKESALVKQQAEPVTNSSHCCCKN